MSELAALDVNQLQTMPKTHLTIDQDVLDVLNRSTITEKTLTLPAQLERKLYDRVMKVIGNAGGVWNKKEKCHVFARDPRGVLGLAIETGVSIDEKKLYQVYYTPGRLANRMVDLADVLGKRVLEPEAGEGALADACVSRGARQVHCIEIRPTACAVLEGKGYSVGNIDFLDVDPKDCIPYERIVMNPPFAGNQDLKHIEHALKFLAPGGILVSLMWPNEDRPQFTRIVEGYGYTTEHVEAGEFQSEGTPVPTKILRIVRVDPVVRKLVRELAVSDDTRAAAHPFPNERKAKAAAKAELQGALF